CPLVDGYTCVLASDLRSSLGEGWWYRSVGADGVPPPVVASRPGRRPASRRTLSRRGSRAHHSVRRRISVRRSAVGRQGLAPALLGEGVEGQIAGLGLGRCSAGGQEEARPAAPPSARVGRAPWATSRGAKIGPPGWPRRGS